MEDTNDQTGGPTPLAVLQALVAHLANVEARDGWISHDDVDEAAGWYAPEHVADSIRGALSDWLVPTDAYKVPADR